MTNTPRMFIWRSEALSNYAHGYIIVVATNETDARRFATLEVREYVRQRTEDFFLEEDARQELLDIALRDLEAEPEQAMSLLLTGSE